MQGLRVRKLADTSEGHRIPGFDPITGEKTLINPDTNKPEPWPMAGLQIEGETPTQCRVPTSFIAKGQAEGWIEVENPRVVHKSGGPPSNEWQITHTFVHMDYVVLKCVEGDVRYRVVHQPDKYDDDSEPSGKRVDWFYDLELEA